MLHNRYRLQEQLGSGGMGAVYRALDRLTGEMVALKQVHIKPRDLEFMSRTDRSDPESLRIALAHEFQTLATLRHPNIISVLDYGFDREQQPYFTMPLLEERRTILEAGRERDTAGRADLLVQLLQALAYLHRRGILHRDLKPPNVLVTSEDVVKVVDFGLAAATEASEGIAGTIAYMAPERLNSEPTTSASDLYSVGVIAYELLVGRYPFDDASIFKLINDILFAQPNMNVLPSLQPTDLVQTLILGDESRRDLEVPTPAPIDAFNPLALIIERLLAKDPAARYHEAIDAIQDLNVAMGREMQQETDPVRDSFLQAARFVGREAEMNQLEAALKRAIEGQGSAWLVGGESGVGKTRLLDEMRIKALVKGAVVMRGQTVAEAGPPYQLWRDPLRQLVLMVQLSDTEASIIRQVIPGIETLLGRSVGSTPEMGGEAGQARLIDTILALFRRSGDAVIALFLEDLQWASTSLEVLRHLLRVIDELPMLVVCTYRDDEHSHLAQMLSALQHIKLERLDPDDVAELSAAMLGHAGRQPHVLDLLQRESEGNVYFLIEVARTLAEEAGSTSAIGSKTLPEHVFARGIETVVQRRLQQMPEIGREMLNLAAIIGRRLDIPVLRHLYHKLGFEFDLEDWLNIGNNCAVLAVREGQWWFAHDKLRERVIADLKPQLRPKYYRLVAEAIETVYPDNLDYATLLQRLWAGAGFLQKEARYAYEAGRLALWQGHVNKALPLLERAMAVRADAHVYEALGEAYLNAGNLNQAEKAYEQSLTLAMARGDRPLIARTLRGLGVLVQMVRGDLSKARSFLERSLGLASQIIEREEVAWSLLTLGQVATRQGELDLAEHCFNEALTLADDVTDRAYVGRLYVEIGNLARRRDDLERAEEQYEQALTRYQGVGSRRGVVQAQTLLASVALERGDMRTARDLGRNALLTAWEMGALPAVLTALALFVEIHRKDGDLHRAGAIAALIEHHPAHTSHSHDLAAPFAATVDAALSPADKELTQEMARAVTLEQMVMQILIGGSAEQ